MISPLDGRYKEKLTELDQIFSEESQTKIKIEIELDWLKHISPILDINTLVDNYNMKTITPRKYKFQKLEQEEFNKIKDIEKTTKHDIKAIEIYLKEQIGPDKGEYIHYLLTSEDINSLATSFALKRFIQDIWSKKASSLVKMLEEFAKTHRDVPMLARTHGQPASPTTLGKEIAVYTHRLKKIFNKIINSKFYAKFSGATGNYNAHYFVHPNINWMEICRKFVERYDLIINPLTTQVDDRDWMAELFFDFIRFNNVLLAFSRDMWYYISLNYFKQDFDGDHVGSSTMPHKVNPIDFENSEGNVAISNSLFNVLANNITVNRLQRDLSDSTQIRNIGVAFAHNYLAILSFINGFSKVYPDFDSLERDLESSVVLAEAAQLLMKKCGVKDSYEIVKDASRNHPNSWRLYVDLPKDLKSEFLEVEPSDYVGIASNLVDICLE